MSSIRKHRSKWQVQFRRKGTTPVTRSFLTRRDAEIWARQIEVLADRHDLPVNPKHLEGYTLGDLVRRYLKSESPKKKGYEREIIILSAFLRHRICAKRLSALSANDFASYRDERLKTIKATSLKRQLSPLHNKNKFLGKFETPFYCRSDDSAAGEDGLLTSETSMFSFCSKRKRSPSQTAAVRKTKNDSAARQAQLFQG